MALNPSPFPSAVRDQAGEVLLRRLTDEAVRTGRRLAQLEFEGLCRELEQPDALCLTVAFANRSGEAGKMIHLGAGRLAMPPLAVPIGRVAWCEAPEALPVVAIDIPQRPVAQTAAALRGLLAEHHRKPFARFLFLAETPDPLALLGRYGMAVICRGTAPAEEVARVEAPRFNIVELRGLFDARVLWRP